MVNLQILEAFLVACPTTPDISQLSGSFFSPTLRRIYFGLNEAAFKTELSKIHSVQKITERIPCLCDFCAVPKILRNPLDALHLVHCWLKFLDRLNDMLIRTLVCQLSSESNCRNDGLFVLRILLSPRSFL